ncbi:MAG: hypothetical protein HKM24_01820, partial [Gammaproteobacteria bacterium]|nr:hypothetical protein [Gammaproteobacteria bacterium]
MTTPIRKSLNTLLQPEGLAAPASLWVSDITLHSDDVTPGSLFIAVAGHQYHGLQFVEQAIANGAQAILWESAPGI